MLCEKKVEMSKCQLSKMKTNFNLEVRKLGRSEEESVCASSKEKRMDCILCLGVSALMGSTNLSLNSSSGPSGSYLPLKKGVKNKFTPETTSILFLLFLSPVNSCDN